MKIGRNDPCWCGSGTKYKKCHLSSDEVDARKERELEKEADALRDPLVEKLATEILEGAQRWHTREDFESAREIYYDADPHEIAPDTGNEEGFLEWYIRDFRPILTGRTPIEEYLDEAESRLLPRERELVEAWRDGKYSFFEIERVDFGIGVLLRDLLDGAEYFVDDPIISKQGQQWDCLLTHLDRFDGKWMVSGDTLLTSRFIARELLATFNTPELLRAHSYEIHRKVDDLTLDWLGDAEVAELDDDLGEPVSEEFICSDEAAVTAEFRKVVELAEMDGAFQWLGSDGEVLATAAIGGGRLRLESQNSTRLEIFGELVGHLTRPYLSTPEM